MVPPATPATSSLSLISSSPEGIDNYSSDFVKETSRSRRGASTSVIIIIIIVIIVFIIIFIIIIIIIIVRTAGTTVLGSLGIILVWG